MIRVKSFVSLAATFVLALAVGQVFSSTGDQSNPHDGAHAIAEKLADCIGRDDFDALKAEAWQHCVDEAVVAHLADQISLPYKRMCEGLGTRTKIELLKAEAAGPSIARYSYAEFHTRGVIVWQFEFIKPNDAWKLHAYGWGPLRMEGAQSDGLLTPMTP